MQSYDVSILAIRWTGMHRFQKIKKGVCMTSDTIRDINNDGLSRGNDKAQDHNLVGLDSYSFRGFVQFIKNNPLELAIALIFLLVGFGQKLFSNAFSIDTDGIISRPSALYQSWIALDRFGLVAFKKVFGFRWYNNNLASFLMVIFFGLAALVWAYLICGLAKAEAGVHPAFFIIPFVVSPVMAEMLGFLLLGPEIGIALTFVAIGLMFISNAVSMKRRILLIFGLVFSTSAFTMYLAMTTIFVLGAAILCMLREQGVPRKIKNNLLFLTYFVLSFVLSFVLYFVANKVVMAVYHVETNSYISDQNHWGKDPFGTIIQNVLQHALDMYRGTGIFYTGFFTLFVFCFLVVCVIQVIKKELGIFQLVVGLLICVSPMMMSVILASVVSVRTEMTYPLAFAFVVYFTLQEMNKYKYLRTLAVLVLIAVGCNQAFIVNRIFYTESVVFQQDVITAAAVEQRISEVSTASSTPTVVFLGNHVANGNPDTYKDTELGYTGRSVLEIGFSTGHGTGVKQSFMRATLGVSYGFPDENQIIEANKLIDTLPSWPSVGSVVRLPDGLVVVRF